MLLELKADMSIKNKDGKTASQLACTLGFKDCVAVFQKEDKDSGIDLTTVSCSFSSVTSFFIMYT